MREEKKRLGGPEISCSVAKSSTSMVESVQRPLSNGRTGLEKRKTRKRKSKTLPTNPAAQLRAQAGLAAAEKLNLNRKNINRPCTCLGISRGLGQSGSAN